MNIKINFDKYEVKDTTKANDVKVLMLKGEPGAGALWGDIDGTITNQTDLNNLINAKISDTYGTSNANGYSQNYLNNKLVKVGSSVDSN